MRKGLRTPTSSEKKVLDYIMKHKEPPGPDVPGRFQQSILEISKGAGVSVSTAHRAIDRLRTRGYFVIRPPADKRQPNIIEYVGPQRPGVPGLVVEAKEKIEELRLLLDSIENDYSRLSSPAVNGPDSKSVLYAFARGYEVVSVTDLPDGNKVILISPKKESVAESNDDDSS